MPPPQKASMQSTDFKEQERARPSGTHSTEVPLRTCPEYAPKDAPRLDASFACSSSGRNISGISREPLLRTNAKSQAVTGEPFRAGSAPIAPAATTPQPAGRSIAYSAAILRRGINVRLFGLFDWDGAVRRGRGRRGSLQTERCRNGCYAGVRRMSPSSDRQSCRAPRDRERHRSWSGDPRRSAS